MGNYKALTTSQIEENLGDLDYAILALLPDSGAMLGLVPSVKSAKFLLTELNRPFPPEVHLAIGVLNARLRLLKKGGVTIDVSTSPNGRPAGWQRTERGKELLDSFLMEKELETERESNRLAAERYRNEQSQEAEWATGGGR